MPKKAHKIIYIACMVCFLVFNPIAFADKNTTALKNTTAEQMNFVQQDVKVNDLDIEPINTQALKKEVIPDTKKEGKKVLAYFLRAMLGVAFCSIILYLILVFIKKYYGSAFANNEEEEYFEAFDLSTPNNKQDALKAFLNRTK